jgi:hypothetical protein
MMVSAMDRFLTARQGIALDIAFGLQGESRFNREIDDWGATYKYIYVASRAPKLAVLHADINGILRNMAAAGDVPFDICSFKKGDHYYQYDKFPKSLSLETVRRAWVKSGMRELQLQHKRLKAKSGRKH